MIYWWHFCRSLPIYIRPDDDTTFITKPSFNLSQSCKILVVVQSLSGNPNWKLEQLVKQVH